MDRHSPDAHNSGQQTEYTPHSGVSGIETPVNDFDNTTLREAEERGLIEVPGAVPTDLIPTYTQTAESEKPSKKKLSLGAKIGAGAAGLLIAGGAVFGVTQLNNGGENNTPPEDDPKDTTQVEEEPAPVEEEPTVETPELITSLQDTTWEGFSASPRTEQVAYSYYRLDQNADRHTDAVVDKDRTTWTEPSHDMTGQQIVDNFNYVRDESGLSYEIVDGEHALDKDEAIKILSGAYYDNSGSVLSSKSFINDRDYILNSDGLFITNQKQTVVSESEIKQSDDRDGNPVESKEITVVDQNGYNITMEFFYLEYPDTNGDTASTWLLFEQHVNE
ncbi:MAG: hypothetical protein ACREGE_02580 [Candidatus Microsaccharimonas sp.]